MTETAMDIVERIDEMAEKAQAKNRKLKIEPVAGEHNCHPLKTALDDGADRITLNYGGDRHSSAIVIDKRAGDWIAFDGVEVLFVANDTPGRIYVA